MKRTPAFIMALALLLSLAACTFNEGLEFTRSDDRTAYLVTGIGSCTGSHIVIPSVHRNKPVAYIGPEAFSNCTAITGITIPDSVTYIGHYAFQGCIGLTDIAIPDSVTRIGFKAFEGCTGLADITIGNGVTYIEDEAFWGCIELKSITFEGTKAQWNVINKGSDWNYGTGEYTVYCTDGNFSKADS